MQGIANLCAVSTEYTLARRCGKLKPIIVDGLVLGRLALGKYGPHCTHVNAVTSRFGTYLDDWAIVRDRSCRIYLYDWWMATENCSLAGSRNQHHG